MMAQTNLKSRPGLRHEEKNTAEEGAENSGMSEESTDDKEEAKCRSRVGPELDTGDVGSTDAVGY